ncbi:MAG: tyrosine-type recombinase/integrase [Deltaproteobacteria bacterium]|nr:tyrosine-type recombinase/integrase [Deltaproteobacteria bacterium]
MAAKKQTRSSKREIEVTRGFLEQAVSDYLKWMVESRYNSQTCTNYGKTLRQFITFVGRKRSAANEVFTLGTLNRFIRTHEKCYAHAIRGLSRYLYAQKRIPEPIPRVEYYLPEIYEDYLDYRKKIHHTPYRKRKQIKRVLAAFHDYLKKHKQGLRTLKIDHIDAFHAKFNPAFALRSQQLYRYYLRGFISYLYHQKRWIKIDLAPLMVGPPVYTRAKPPKFLRRKQIAAVFDNLSCLTANDLRTYAMAHLAYFLGLRPQEIVQIQLDAISFKNAELTLEDRKNNIPTKLPLPERVVKAIAAYIIGGRPKSKSQLLFLGHLPPHGPVAAARVSCDLSSCLKKVNRKATGYWLRHTYAQNLLEAGASYYDIKEMLGHDHIESTKQYLSIHIEMMRKVLFDETL